MRIFITGISGFIGQELSKKFVDFGHEVYGLYETKESFLKNPEVKEENKAIGNLVDFEEITAIIDRVKPDIVIHLAAKTEVAFSFDNYIQVSEVNYVGTVNLAEANRKLNPNLKAFIMASTMETYGHQNKEDGAFTEETEQKPMAPYAVAKLACEKYLEYMRYAYNFPYIILRQTNAYGRHDNDFFVVEQIITQMLYNSEKIQLGEPDAYRNFLYIDDLVNLYETLISKTDIATGQTFVTGPDNALTIRELVDIIADKLNWKGEVEWHVKPKRPGEIFYLNSNPSKAKELLDWEPKVSLHDGLDKTIAKWRPYAS